MLCRHPLNTPVGLVSCGRCINCRVTAQKVWAGRILLESYWYPRSAFITLTYRDEDIPVADGVQILHKPDLEEFRQKLRYRTRNLRPLRYASVGEYGSESWRPHYHLVVFGHGVEIEPHVLEAWPHGYVQVSELTYDRAMYIAQYTMKKLTREGDENLKGRPPEFFQPSLKPGLGVPGIGWLADVLHAHDKPAGAISKMFFEAGDVFNHFRCQGKMFPLGTYMKRQLRRAVGLSDCPRKRAIELGRFDHSTGEIDAEKTETTFAPATDLAYVNTPFTQQIRRAERIAKQAEVDKRAAKSDRQIGLNLTTGGRI